MKFLRKLFSYDITLAIMLVTLSFMIGYLSCYVKYLRVFRYEEVSDVMNEVQKNIYNADTFNCVDFSKDAQNKLKEKGIGSTLIVGHRKGDPTTHAFIGVWIDPQTGEFVNDYDFYGTIEP